MLAITIDTETERRLSQAALQAGESPDILAGRALLAYLEDLEDYAAAVEAMRTHDPSETVKLEDVLRDLDLDG